MDYGSRASGDHLAPTPRFSYTLVRRHVLFRRGCGSTHLDTTAMQWRGSVTAAVRHDRGAVTQRRGIGMATHRASRCCSRRASRRASLRASPRCAHRASRRGPARAATHVTVQRPPVAAAAGRLSSQRPPQFAGLCGSTAAWQRHGSGTAAVRQRHGSGTAGVRHSSGSAAARQPQRGTAAHRASRRGSRRGSQSLQPTCQPTRRPSRPSPRSNPRCGPASARRGSPICFDRFGIEPITTLIHSVNVQDVFTINVMPNEMILFRMIE